MWEISINYLFICSRNQWRSPTAERILQQVTVFIRVLRGTSRHAKHSLTVKDIAWADCICVMEQKHKTWIKEKFHKELSHKKIIVLDIPDDYQYMDEDLIEILKQSMQYYLD